MYEVYSTVQYNIAFSYYSHSVEFSSKMLKILTFGGNDNVVIIYQMARFIPNRVTSTQ